MRRNRAEEWVRRLTRESNVTPDDLIWPMFVQQGSAARTPVPSMPGVDRLSIDLVVEAVGEAKALGIPAVAIFPVTPQELKSEDGKEATNSDNLACRTVRAIKEKYDDIGVICDVALDPYTTHGQDGIVRDGKILNDETVEVLCQQAFVQAQAGCDVIAPSDMMDGRVAAIRKALDDEGLDGVSLLAYSAKYASAFYGPFREAVNSALQGDRATYQQDPANRSEAGRELRLDLAEGADMVMVKPALPYLDVLADVAASSDVPVAAYHVSGEYSQIEAAVDRGWLDREAAVLEALTSIRRAGAHFVLTYYADYAGRLLDRTDRIYG
jgi:porphobilinogen synthase